MTLYSFEAEMLDWIQERKVSFTFDESRHFIQSKSFSIQFIPNLSAPNNLEFIEEINLNTIRLWEDVYTQKEPLVKSILNSRIGLNTKIHARQTTVELISQSVLDIFLDENHLLGKAKCKYRIGLFLKGEMLAVIAFGRSCPVQYQEKTYRSHELIRYCSKRGTTIVGGLTKLLTHFERQYKPEHIMTYVDKEWSDGENYIKIGFDLVAETDPEIFWFSLADGNRYREHDRDKTTKTEPSRWLEIKNLGNYKFVKLYN